MALPAEFLNKSPEQQEAALKEAQEAYYQAEPEQRKQAGRKVLERPLAQK